MNPSEEMASLRAELEAARTENKMLRLAGVLSKSHSIRESAMEDVMTRIKNAFVTEEGRMVPIDPARGETPEAFVAKLRVSAPHLFQPSSGSGSRGSGGSLSSAARASAEMPNPFKKETFNLTKQAMLMKTNRPLYDRLKAEAKA